MENLEVASDNQVLSDAILAVVVSGGVHAVPGVAEEPDITLTDWSVFEVEGLLAEKVKSKTRHLAGWDASNREGRVSSPIVEFNPATRVAKTRSGRTYSLQGPPGYDKEAQYVWARWTAINKIQPGDQREVTSEYYA